MQTRIKNEVHADMHIGDCRPNVNVIFPLGLLVWMSVTEKAETLFVSLPASFVMQRSLVVKVEGFLHCFQSIRHALLL